MTREEYEARRQRVKAQLPTPDSFAGIRGPFDPTFGSRRNAPETQNPGVGTFYPRVEALRTHKK